MPVITVEVTTTASATAISKMTSAATAKATNGLSPGSGLIIAFSVFGLLAFVGFMGIVLPLAWNDYGQWCFPLCSSVGWAKDKAQTAEPTREKHSIAKTIGSLFRVKNEDIEMSTCATQGSSSTTSSTPSEDCTANEKHTRNSVAKLCNAFTSLRYSVTRRSGEPASGSGSGSSAHLTETASVDRLSATLQNVRASPRIPVNINADMDVLEAGVVGGRTGVIETEVDFDARLDLLEALAIIPEEGMKQKEK
ncbi:hypothetical protein CcaverHIS002_0406760 [Cutaneotrichosporon cavernicola]|nr:hypothetical protein CcaverHIS002_0406760 [Cutaneotrichosporon cavernicola]